MAIAVPRQESYSPTINQTMIDLGFVFVPEQKDGRLAYRVDFPQGVRSSPAVGASSNSCYILIHAMEKLAGYRIVESRYYSLTVRGKYLVSLFRIEEISRNASAI